MEIQIHGLTDRQRAIADVLWILPGKEAVLSFISSLEANTRKDAQIVLDMMVAAVMDDVTEVDLARSELDKYRL